MNGQNLIYGPETYGQMDLRPKPFDPSKVADNRGVAITGDMLGQYGFVSYKIAWAAVSDPNRPVRVAMDPAVEVEEIPDPVWTDV